MTKEDPREVLLATIVQAFKDHMAECSKRKTSLQGCLRDELDAASLLLMNTLSMFPTDLRVQVLEEMTERVLEQTNKHVGAMGVLETGGIAGFDH